MTFLPIVDRELRVAARRRGTFRIRVASAVVAAIIGGWALLMARLAGGFMFRPGQMMFGALSGLAFAYCLLGGILKTADCLSEEKREGTLGLMFLTDLKGYDIVLGKIVATSLNWFYGLLAVFPILGLSLLMGGVAPGQFWRTILALVNLLFVSLATGLFVSSFSRHERRALAGTTAALFLLLNVPSWLAAWHQDVTGGSEPTALLLLPNPGHAYSVASDVWYARQSDQYWGSLLVSHALGWGLLALTSGLVARNWRDRPSSAWLARWRQRDRNRWFGKPAKRAALRKVMLQVNPYYWRVARERWTALIVYGAVTLAVSFPLQEALTSGEPIGYLFWTVWLQAAMKVWVAFEACRHFVEDRRSGTMELLLCTSLSVRDILRGQWRALREQFTGGVVLMLAATLVFMVAGVTWLDQGRGGLTPWQYALMFAVVMTMFLLDLVAIGWLGMWRGMTSAHATRAAGWTVLVILVLPWVIFCAVYTAGLTVTMFGMALKGTSGAGPPRILLSPEFHTAVWFGIGLSIDLAFGLWARRKLYREFRTQAARQFESDKPDWWRPTRRTATPPTPPRLLPASAVGNSKLVNSR